VTTDADPDALMSAGASTSALVEDRDMPADEQLLGIPWSSFAQVRALRGFGLLVLALVILLWPDRTNTVLAVLIGAALALYAGVTLVEVIQDAGRRQFQTMVSIAVAGGLAASLIAHPADSLMTVAQGLGGVLVGMAVIDVIQSLWRRDLTSWEVVRGVGVALAGALLMAFPVRLLTTATSLVAVLLAAAAVVDVFHPAPPDDDDANGIAGVGPLLSWLRRRPYMTEDREVLKQKVFFEGASAPTRFARFAALMLFASVIASVGVVVESTAVVIGAMLVAPLMVPLMGAALSVAMGWPRRLNRCIGVAVTGIVLAIATGALVGAVMPRTVDVTSNTEIIARISPTVVDLAIAIAAGAAGAYALSRRDVSDSLPGVAVAIALVPPLTVVGLCWQQQAWAAGNGALLLFMTNGMAILTAGGAMFVLVGAVPLSRVSQTQQRLRTVIVALLSLFVVVVVLLALNGRQLATADLARADIDGALSDWSLEHDDYRVVDTRATADGVIIIDLTGPGEPPDLDMLVAELETSLGDDITVQVHWTEQQQLIIDSG
jgi:uncharacterized hydrophobic protein (TIGR00271 family)